MIHVNANRVGRCRLCGLSDKKLSPEHIPPYSAFNTHDVIEKGALKKSVGYYRYVLCEYCNNLTSPYAKEYVNAAKIAAGYIDNIPHTIIRDAFDIRLYIRPLFFIKYLLLLTFTTSDNICKNECLRDYHPKLIDFIMNKNETCLDDKYRVHLNLFNTQMMSTSGIVGRKNIESGCLDIFTEFKHPPFCVLTSIGHSYDNMKDISFMSRASTKKISIWVPCRYVQPYGLIPGNYKL